MHLEDVCVDGKIISELI